MRALRPLPFFAAAAFAVALAAGAPALSGCDGQQACDSAVAFATDDITSAGATVTGPEIEAGQCVTVNYVGRLADGSGTFDEGTLLLFSGRDPEFVPGFSRGVVGQRQGETRRVTIPPGLAYGPGSRPARLGFVGGDEEGGERYVGIPACSVLSFDLTVVRVNQDSRVCTER